MKELTIIQQAKPAKLEEIEAFERQQSIRLPADFKQFLISVNPIDVKETFFVAKDREHWLSQYIPVEKEYWVHAFCPFDESYEMSIQSSHKRLYWHFENRYLRFAYDAGNWSFVVSVQEKDFGKIYFCRMDQPLEKALALIADTFEEFIDGLEIWASDTE